ncbi:MAG: CdaR family protein [Bacteroidales bacterium]
MDSPENIIENKTTIDRKKLIPDKRIAVFLFFVFVSALFWFLNQLEATYETNISYPVRFENFPKNKIIVGEMPDHFTVRVKARGFKILEYKISNTFLPYVIDVSKLTLRFHSSNKNSTFFTLTRMLEDNIESQMGADFQVLSIEPDTLFFDFTKIATKKVPVYSPINAETDPQYMIKGKVIFDPDSVLISGAKQNIDTIKQVLAEDIKIERLSKDFTDELDIIPIKNVDISNSSANILIRVEKFTEGSQLVEIKTLNVPDSLFLRVFPNETTVSYHVGLSDYKKVIPQLFDIIVDYNDIKSQPQKLNLKINNHPDYLQSVRIFPTSVEYIIERK